MTNKFATKKQEKPERWRPQQILKSTTWFILTLMIGLCPIWIVLLIEMSFDKIPSLVVNGGILFFSIVLISSLMIDHFLFGDTTLNFGIKFMFSIFPIFLIIPSVALFTICYMAPDHANSHLEFIGIAQIVILAITAIYAILIKLDYLGNLDICKTQQKTKEVK